MTKEEMIERIDFLEKTIPPVMINKLGESFIIDQPIKFEYRGFLRGIKFVLRDAFNTIPEESIEVINQALSNLEYDIYYLMLMRRENMGF